MKKRKKDGQEMLIEIDDGFDRGKRGGRLKLDKKKSGYKSRCLMIVIEQAEHRVVIISKWKRGESRKECYPFFSIIRFIFEDMFT